MIKEICADTTSISAAEDPHEKRHVNLHHRSFFESSECSETAGGETASKGWLPIFGHLQEGGTQMNSSRASFYYRSFFRELRVGGGEVLQRDLCRHFSISAAEVPQSNRHETCVSANVERFVCPRRRRNAQLIFLAAFSERFRCAESYSNSI